MTIDREAALILVARRSLEEWGMMLVEDFDENSPTDPGSLLYSARLAFQGVVSGWIGVVATSQLMQQLAANVMGLDEDEVEAEFCKDSLKELANVITGNVLTMAYGVDVVFDLLPPTVVSLNSQRAAELFEGSQWHKFLADDQYVAVTFGEAVPSDA